MLNGFYVYSHEATAITGSGTGTANFTIVDYFFAVTGIYGWATSRDNMHVKVHLGVKNMDITQNYVSFAAFTGGTTAQFKQRADGKPMFIIPGRERVEFTYLDKSGSTNNVITSFEGYHCDGDGNRIDVSNTPMILQQKL